MRPIWIILIIVALIGAGFYIVFEMKSGGVEKNSTVASNVTQSEKRNPGQERNFCLPEQLKASIDPEGGAGNMYGKITIKNISQTECQIVANNILRVEYPTTVANFEIVKKGAPSMEIETIVPSQTIYSLIHFPNGPQCSGKSKNIYAFVSYAISEKNTVIFNTDRGNTMVIPSCENVSEKTEIDLYPFSRSEVKY